MDVKWCPRVIQLLLGVGVGLLGGCVAEAPRDGTDHSPCSEAADCESGVCSLGHCAPPSCTDGVRNGAETDVDCGGACARCDEGQACGANADCKAGLCSAGRCAPPTCGDGLRNGGETDVDCGGSCSGCGLGRACSAAADCADGVCGAGRCVAATCADKVKNGAETDVDCGGSCGACAATQACAATADCQSGVCTGGRCQAPSCTDNVKNGAETDVDCSGSCGRCAVSQACAAGADCASLVCQGSRCQQPASCQGVLAAQPMAVDGTYTIDPDGAGPGAPFLARCDMGRDGGGWTLVLKADGAVTLGFASALWTNDQLLAPDDLSLTSGNAKLQGFLSLPVRQLRGELDGFRYFKDFDGTRTARQIFAGPADIVSGHPGFGDGTNWSTQPNCKNYGVNSPYDYRRARFGWVANQENDCASLDTAIGLGLYCTAGGCNEDHGAGYLCQSTLCSRGNVNTGGDGKLWVR